MVDFKTYNGSTTWRLVWLYFLSSLFLVRLQDEPPIAKDTNLARSRISPSIYHSLSSLSYISRLISNSSTPQLRLVCASVTFSWLIRKTYSYHQVQQGWKLIFMCARTQLTTAISRRARGALCLLQSIDCESCLMRWNRGWVQLAYLLALAIFWPDWSTGSYNYDNLSLCNCRQS